jgi:LPS-assembly lipoprotein
LVDVLRLLISTIINHGKRIKSVFVICLLLGVAACGYHLRTSATIPDALQPVLVDGLNIGHPVVQKLNLLLASNNVLATQAADPATRITLVSDHWARRVLSVDAQGNPLEYQLKYELTFRIKNEAKEELLVDDELNILRAYSYDASQVLASSSQEDQLKQLMYEDAANQILRRLSFLK